MRISDWSSDVCSSDLAVLLKPLRQAERDGDSILAVIRGSAENHGGMSTSLIAPNPKAQASLIAEAPRKAGVDPRSVGYRSAERRCRARGCKYVSISLVAAHL